MNYIAASLLAGSLFFGMIVWRPVAHRQAVEPALDADVTRTLKSLALAGLVGACFATIGFILFQSQRASQGFSNSSPDVILSQLLAGPQSWILWLRILILAVLAVLVPKLQPARQALVRTWAAALGLGAVFLFTYSLQSHSAALGSIPGLLLDWLHLLAMAAWLGGLAPLLGTLVKVSNQGQNIQKELVPRFSRVALAGVTLLAATGLYSTFLHVRTPEALVATSYGRSLVAKNLLFALLISLGAVNLLAISPRLHQASSNAALWLRRMVRVEMLLGLLVLLAAGLLAGLAPAFEALEAQERQGFLQQVRQDTVRLTFRVAPARVGENEFGIDVVDPRPGVESTRTEVLLRLRSAANGIDPTQVETTSLDARRFTARGSFLTMAGDWEIEVILRRSGFDDVRHTFTFNLPAVSPPLADPVELPGSNPVPASESSLAAGRALYETNCVSCHGSEGKGDGPVGLTLNPRPADLSQHALPGVHPDQQLFEWISQGYPGSVMPAYEHHLTEEERWHLVNYMRTLAAETAPGLD